MKTEPKSKAKGCLISATVFVGICIIGLVAVSFPFYWAWKDEPKKEAHAIAVGEQLSAERAARLITQAKDIVAGKPYSLPPKDLYSGPMWSDEYGYPKEFSDIRPYRIDVIANDEVCFVTYHFFDTEVAIAVVGLKTKPKVILRTGLDEKYRYRYRKTIYEE